MRKVPISRAPKGAAQPKGVRASIYRAEGDMNIAEEIADGGYTDTASLKE
jgi:hypothetical protein